MTLRPHEQSSEANNHIATPASILQEQIVIAGETMSVGKLALEYRNTRRRIRILTVALVIISSLLAGTTWWGYAGHLKLRFAAMATQAIGR